MAAVGWSTNRGWVIRRYEGMQRVEGRTQSGLHFSCRGRPGSYWKYLHVIYGAHMLQEPNAPPCYPLLPSLPFACPYSLPPFAQTPFPPLFLFDCHPFSVLRNGMLHRCSFSLFLFLSHSSPSSAHESAPKPAGNVSRILQNVSRLSHCFRFLLTDKTTNTRMDWIFDGADPSGPSTHTLQSSHHLFPSRLRCSAILVHLVRTAWKRRDDFLFLYRFLQKARDTISNKVGKGASKKNGEMAMHALHTYTKLKGKNLSGCYSASMKFKKMYNTKLYVSSVTLCKANFTPCSFYNRESQ